MIARKNDTTIQNVVGDLTIATAHLPGCGRFLTVVFQDGKPFDVAISNTAEAAAAEHRGFVEVAMMVQGFDSPMTRQ